MVLIMVFGRAEAGPSEHNPSRSCCAAIGHRQIDLGRPLFRGVGQEEIDAGFGNVGHRLHDGGAGVFLVAKAANAVESDDLYLLRHVDPEQRKYAADLVSEKVGDAKMLS